MNPLETSLQELAEIRASGARVKETFYYGPDHRFLDHWCHLLGSHSCPKLKFRR